MGAEFVLRNGVPRFSVSDDDRATQFLERVIQSNRLEKQYLDMLIAAAHCGAVAVKWNVDLEDARCPVQISVLSVPNECRFWFDPHDRTKPLMCRIQYPIRDYANGGNWAYYRQEWTNEMCVDYISRPAGIGADADITQCLEYQETFGDSEEWEVASVQANPFGVIPVTILRNRTLKGNPLGLGDCWGTAFRLIDRIALTLHWENRANQMHAMPQPVSINARIQNEGVMLPGEPLEIINDGDKNADYKLVEPSGAAREWTHKDIDRWTALLYEEVGLSQIDAEAIGNKGNMTELALQTAYQRTIATSDQKREQFGNSGLAIFFANMLVGLKRMGGFKEIMHVDYDVQVACAWPRYFSETPQDLADTTERTIKQVDNHLVSHEQAIKRVASVEKLPHSEHDDMIAQLVAERQAAQQAQASDKAQE